MCDYFKVNADLLRSTELSVIAKLVLNSFVAFSYTKGAVEISYDHFAYSYGVSVEEIETAVEELIKKGYVLSSEVNGKKDRMGYIKYSVVLATDKIKNKFRNTML